MIWARGGTSDCPVRVESIKIFSMDYVKDVQEWLSTGMDLTIAHTLPYRKFLLRWATVSIVTRFEIDGTVRPSAAAPATWDDGSGMRMRG